jgi:tripartite-type tricarboxylate transporter receptor subunit TctC
LFSAVDSNLVANPFLYHITYDPFRDFAPIGVIVRVRLVLMVPPSGPNTLQQLIAKAKANPGKLNYASVGFGSAHHLGMEHFKLRTKTNIVHVPFKGATAAIAALLGGQIDVPRSDRQLRCCGPARSRSSPSPRRVELRCCRRFR